MDKKNNNTRKPVQFDKICYKSMRMQVQLVAIKAFHFLAIHNNACDMVSMNIWPPLVERINKYRLIKNNKHDSFEMSTVSRVSD